MGQAYAGQHHVLRLQPGSQPCGTKTMRSTIRDLGIRHRTQVSLADIARQINPLLRGWIEYYGRYAASALSPILRYVNQTLLAWAMRKYKRFGAHKIRASRFLQRIAETHAELFVHWRIGMSVPDGSRVRRESRARLCVQRRLACSAGAGVKVRRPVVLDSRVAGNQDSEAYRKDLPWGDYELPGRK
jgi:hypothetical protein